jgi:hypothetical protein
MATFDSTKTALGKILEQIVDGKIRTNAQVGLTETDQDEILDSHLIDPTLLRADDFQGFFAARKVALLEIISSAMGTAILPADLEAVAEDQVEEDEED